MAFVSRAQVLETLKEFVPEPELEARLQDVLEAARLKDKPHFLAEEVARLGHALMTLAQRQLRDAASV